MSRKTKRDLEDQLEQLRTNATEITVHTSVTVVTDDMVDEEGNTIDSKMPDPSPPDGFELGDKIPTESAACDCYELIQLQK